MGESFPLASILSLEIKNAIQEFQKATARKKPNFYLSAFIVDIFCANIFCVEFCFPNMGWSWVLPAPPVHIYHFELWDTNYVTMFYDICESILGWVHFLIFNKEAPTFSPETKYLIATMGDWYVSESFTYIMVFGRNATHMFPKDIPDRLCYLPNKLVFNRSNSDNLFLRSDEDFRAYYEIFLGD